MSSRRHSRSSWAYETAARAQEALSLNVEDVDLDTKRARVRSEGGDLEGLHLQSDWHGWRPS